MISVGCAFESTLSSQENSKPASTKLESKQQSIKSRPISSGSPLQNSTTMNANVEDRPSPERPSSYEVNGIDPTLDLMQSLNPELLDDILQAGGADVADDAMDSATIPIGSPEYPTDNLLTDTVFAVLGQDAKQGIPAQHGTGIVLDEADAGTEDVEDGSVGYVLAEAINIVTPVTPPPSDLVSWLRNAYEYVPLPHDDRSPRVFREDLYAHMARDLPPSATLPSKDQVATLVTEAFLGAKWQSHIDHGPNHVIVGLQQKRGINNRSLSQASRHRYSNSCNLSDLANIAAYAQREMTQSTEARDSYSPSPSQTMSPTNPVGTGPYGTPGRRSALDELAAAAALSQRSPSAKGRKISYGEEQAGGKSKKRRVNAVKVDAGHPEAGSSRASWNEAEDTYLENSDEEQTDGKPSKGKKPSRSSKSARSNGKGYNQDEIDEIADDDQVNNASPSSSGKIGDSSRRVQGSNESNSTPRPQKYNRPKKNIYTNLAVTSSTDPNIKHYKPNFTYHELITHEIKRSVEGRLQLSEIYRRISERYPYFKLGEPGWQNSIRHNLSLKKCFVRVDRPNEAASDKSGKGGWWTYVAQGDPDGRGGRKGLSGKGTGEYRKGQTPSDIASRSGSPEVGEHTVIPPTEALEQQPYTGAQFPTTSDRTHSPLAIDEGLTRDYASAEIYDQARTLAMASEELAAWKNES